MSVSGISSSSFSDYNTQSVQNRMQQVRQEFQQLGQDLQSGNLSAAQTDFATLQQLRPPTFVGPTAVGQQTSSTSSSQSNSPIAQEFNQLSQDLQSGNVSAAQKDYATIQQSFQTQASQTHHHHHGGGGSGASAISQLLSQLGQALQSGSLSVAQQAYRTLQQDFLQFTQGSGLSLTQAASPSSSNSIAVNA